METPGEIAAKILAKQVGNPTSVEIEVTTTILPQGANAKVPGYFTTYVDHYIETAAGQRFLENRGMNAGAVMLRSTHFADRGKFTDITYENKDAGHQQQAQIMGHFWQEGGNGRKQIPVPLQYFRVGRESLQEALPKAQHEGASECLGRPCEVFLFPKVPWYGTQDQVFHLDKATSAPLKVESFRDAASRENHRPLWVWTAKTLDTVEGRSIALKSSQTAFDSDGKPSYLWDHVVDKIHFNGEIPELTFVPVLQPGVSVYDETTMTFSRAPGAILPPPLPPPAPAAKGAAPVIPPGDHSSGNSGGSLLIAAALILVAGFARWR